MMPYVAVLLLSLSFTGVLLIFMAWRETLPNADYHRSLFYGFTTVKVRAACVVVVAGWSGGRVVLAEHTRRAVCYIVWWGGRTASSTGSGL